MKLTKATRINTNNVKEKANAKDSLKLEYCVLQGTKLWQIYSLGKVLRLDCIIINGTNINITTTPN
jgi:hypothetical protein